MSARALRASAAMVAGLLAACGDRAPSEPEAVRAAVPASAPAWVRSLAEASERIDDAMPGDLGVYVKKLGEDRGVFDRGGGRRWYLSSTVKVPVAIAVMEMVDRGELDLTDTLALNESDFVDGAGDLLWQSPGSRYSIAELIGKSLRESDSTATDMLIRRIGEKRLNDRVRAWTGGGFGELTTILQVRYDAYGALHPGVAELTNLQLVALRNAESGEPRLRALAKTLGVSRRELGADSLESVFEAYYRRGDNSAALAAFAAVLEKLVAGELLSRPSTEWLLGHMRQISTGGGRIQAGLPPGVDFAQKTGTQIGRACNVGAINAHRGRDGAIVVVTCAERFEELPEAEAAFGRLGRALAEAGLLAGE